MKVILRGAPRSGTHLVEQWLLKKHFPDLEVDASYRHRLVDISAVLPNTQLIVCFKHPMAWLVSMQRWVQGFESTGPVLIDGVKYEANSDLEYFILLNPVLFQYWEISHTSWLSFPGVTICDYNSLLKAPLASIDFIGSRLGLEPKAPSGLPHEDLYRKTNFDLDYYLEEHWRYLYDQNVWEYCKEKFNHRLPTMSLYWKEP